MLRRLTSALGAALLLLAGRPAIAAPPSSGGEAQGGAPDQAEVSAEDEDTVNRAIVAWRNGEWTKVRDLLEPLVGDADLGDRFVNESALRYLAEATLLDPGLADPEREVLARGYIDRLLEQDPDWQPPSGLHGRQFYDLVARTRSERDAQLAEACRGQLLACEADFKELEVNYEAAQEKIADLREDLATEDVFLTEVVKRNRGLALLPLGIGHFANGDNALGGAFLALELATGVSALSLLIHRTTYFGCVRTDGFNRNSLVCQGENIQDTNLAAREQAVIRARSAETILAWSFVGSIVLDLTIAQLRFKPVEIVERGQRTRRELETETGGELGPDQTGRTDNTGNTGAGPSAARSTAEPGPSHAPSTAGVRLRFRPHPTPIYIRGGFGLGFSAQF